VQEFEDGAAPVGAFAPLETCGRDSAFLALEILDQRGSSVGEKFADFCGGEHVSRDGFK
jgi:hypothetical protein